MRGRRLHVSNPPETRKKRKRLRYYPPDHIDMMARTLDFIKSEMPEQDVDRMRNDWMERIRTQDKSVKFLNSVADLKEIQSKFEELQATINKERARLTVLYGPIERLNDELKAKLDVEATPVEANYHKLCEQLYTKRFQIVNGLVPVKNAHIHKAMSSSFKDILNNEAMKSAFEDTTKNKGVPDFWLTVMKVKPVLREQINGHDEEVLKFLKDIKLCQVDNPKGFKLEFDFAKNPFFKNQVLTKTYQMADRNELLPQDVIGTVIEWYGDRRLAECESSKRYESFFDFFHPPIPSAEFLIWRQHDNEIRCALQDIIHCAISYFVEETQTHLPVNPLLDDQIPYEYENSGSDEDYSEEEEEEELVDGSFYEFEYQIPAA